MRLFAKSLSCLAVAVLLAPTGAAAGKRGKPAPSLVDKPRLRPISKAKAKRLAASVTNFKVTLDDGQTMPMPWANLVGETCGSRDVLTQYFLATGGKGKALPSKISNARLRALEKNSAVDTVGITLTGPIETTQGYRLPNGRRLKANERLDWFCHHATVVNVAGTLKVIDPSLTPRPLAIRSWARKLLGKGAPVRHLKPKDFNLAYRWNLGDGFKQPKYLAGYQFTTTFKETSIHPPLAERFARNYRASNTKWNGTSTLYKASSERRYLAPS